MLIGLSRLLTSHSSWPLHARPQYHRPTKRGTLFLHRQKYTQCQWVFCEFYHWWKYKQCILNFRNFGCVRLKQHCLAEWPDNSRNHFLSEQFGPGSLRHLFQTVCLRKLQWFWRLLLQNRWSPVPVHSNDQRRVQTYRTRSHDQTHLVWSGPFIRIWSHFDLHRQINQRHFHLCHEMSKRLYCLQDQLHYLLGMRAQLLV